MSSMEIFYGEYAISQHDVTPEDTDDFYDIEDKLGVHFVAVGDVVYEFKKVEELDAEGFMTVIEPSDLKRFICLWYNGGAGLHEVVGELIKNYEGASA